MQFDSENDPMVVLLKAVSKPESQALDNQNTRAACLCISALAGTLHAVCMANLSMSLDR